MKKFTLPGEVPTVDDEVHDNHTTYKCDRCGQFRSYMPFGWLREEGREIGLCQTCWINEMDTLKPHQVPMSPPGPITHEAHDLISGPKREAYGLVEDSFGKAAAVWSAVLGYPVAQRQVALCMAGLKLCREAHKHTRDSCVDGAAYFELAHELGEGEKEGRI